MRSKHFEIENGEFFPYKDSPFSFAFIEKEWLTVPHEYPKTLFMPNKSLRSPRRSRRARTPIAPVPTPSTAPMNAAGNVDGALVAQTNHPESRTVGIDRQLLRTVTECHYSDGTHTTEDRTYPVTTTQKIWV